MGLSKSFNEGYLFVKVLSLSKMSGRFEVSNTHTGMKYVTYGTDEEVRASCARQTVIWKERADQKKGLMRPHRF